MAQMQTMLVVEDEARCRRALQLLLQSKGFDVRTAGSAEEALSELKANSAPTFMVVDVDLPGMCGLDLVEIVQMADCGVEPMLLTAADGAKMALFAASHHVPYFAKPLDIDGFLSFVREKVASRRRKPECQAEHPSATPCRGDRQTRVA